MNHFASGMKCRVIGEEADCTVYDFVNYFSKDQKVIHMGLIFGADSVVRCLPLEKLDVRDE